MVDSKLQHNAASNGGGAEIRAVSGGHLSFTVDNSSVARNRTRDFLSTDGGGLRVVEDGASSQVDVTVTNSQVERNTANVGSAISGLAINGGDGPTLSVTGSVVVKNRGGAIYYLGPVTIDGSRVLRNAGGGLVLGGPATITNSVFAGNTPGGAAPDGTAIAASGDITIVNSTISANRVRPFKTALAVNGNVVIVNTIAWGNLGQGSARDLQTFGGVSLQNCLVGESSGPLVDLGGNLNADPLLVGPPDDVHLGPGSPAIDTGTCSGAPLVDFEGDPRPTGGSCDIGADEFVP